MRRFRERTDHRASIADDVAENGAATREAESGSNPEAGRVAIVKVAFTPEVARASSLALDLQLSARGS